MMRMLTNHAPLSGKEARYQHERLQVLQLSALSYATDTLWLTLLALDGVMALHLPAVFALAATVAVGVPFVVFAQGWNLRMPDPNLTNAQTAASYLIMLAFLVLVPQASPVFLSSLFVIAAFGTLVLSVRQYLWAWCFTGLGMVPVLLTVGGQLAIPVATPFQQLIMWLVVMSALGRVMFLSIRVNRLRDRLRQSNQQLKTSFAEAKQLATLDDLTQVWNRRSILMFTNEERLHAAQSNATFCLAMLDLDHFKSVNDTFGHPTGDEVLKVFAEKVSKILRTSDKFGRYGGEEFMLLLPNESLERGLMVAERVRTEIASVDWNAVAPGLSISISIGITAFRGQEPVEELLARGDAALYEAKHRGRNQTHAVP
jgi:diguanylate cyclase (GGDEF)-like protein